MMKRILSLVLISVLLVVSTSLPAAAFPRENHIDEGAKEKYLKELYEQYVYLPHEQFLMHLEEVYDHKMNDGETDWSIVCVYFEQLYPAAWKAGVVGGRRVYAPGEIYPFIYGFGLYDAKSNRFIDFYDYPDPFADYDYPPDTFGKDNNAHDLFDRYEDLYEVWQSLDISISTPEYYGNPHLIGDANGDLELNIIDATHIQRYTADLISKYIIANDEADTDRDGSITILDATRIQRTLANLCDIDGNPCI